MLYSIDLFSKNYIIILNDKITADPGLLNPCFYG